MTDIMLKNTFQHDLYRLIVESSLDGIAVINGDGIFLLANPAASRLLEVEDPSSLAGRSLLLFLEADAQRSLLKNLLLSASGECSWTAIYRVRSARGRALWVDHRGTSGVYAGQPAHILVLRDVTFRKELEAKLRQLSRAVEQSTNSVVITDLLGSIEYVNPKFTEITGYTLTEARGQNPRILKTEFTPPDEYRRLWETITAGQEWRGEFCNKKKNGELYWEHVAISPIVNEAGRITHFLAVKENVTEYKKALEVVQQSEAKFRTLTETASAAIFICREQFLYINKYMEGLTGYSLAELQDRHFWEIFHPAIQDKIRQTGRRRLLGEPVPGRYETEIVTKNGDILCFDFSASVIDYEGRPAIIGTAYDITEKKKMQVDLQRDVALAGQVQHGLLPPELDHPALILKTVYQPHRLVSGDFYDWSWTSPTKLFGVLVDVTGHGMGTALLTSVIHVLFHEIAARTMPLTEKMRQVNQELMDYFPDDSFAAVFAFELDLTEKHLTYVSGGINYFTMCTPAYCGPVTVPGPLLGINPAAEVEAHTLTVHSGDTFYFMTDGLWEMMEEHGAVCGLSFEETIASLRELAKHDHRWDDASAICLLIK